MSICGPRPHASPLTGTALSGPEWVSRAWILTYLVSLEKPTESDFKLFAPL